MVLRQVDGRGVVPVDGMVGVERPAARCDLRGRRRSASWSWSPPTATTAWAISATLGGVSVRTSERAACTSRVKRRGLERHWRGAL